MFGRQLSAEKVGRRGVQGELLGRELLLTDRSDQTRDGPLDEEALAEKKEKMRQYVEADRKFDAAIDARRRRKKRGCLGNLVRASLVAAAIGGVVYLIWSWHPWETQAVEFQASEHPGVCSEGVDGTKTVYYLTVLGFRVMKTGESTICVE